MQVNPSDPQIPLADQAIIDIKAQHNGELHNGEKDQLWINFGRLRVEERHAAETSWDATLASSKSLRN